VCSNGQNFRIAIMLKTAEGRKPVMANTEMFPDQESVGLMRSLLRGRDGGPKYPDSSSHSHHYVPQNYAIFDSPSLLLATIHLSPTGSWAVRGNSGMRINSTKHEYIVKLPQQRCCGDRIELSTAGGRSTFLCTCHVFFEHHHLIIAAGSRPRTGHSPF